MGRSCQIVPLLIQTEKILARRWASHGCSQSTVGDFYGGLRPYISERGPRARHRILHAGLARRAEAYFSAEAVRLLRRKWRLKPSQVEVWSGPHIRHLLF